MSLILVGGSQRSGTSATQQLLCQLPEANPYLYEASFLRMQVACYADAKATFSNNHASYFGDVQNLRNFQSGVVNAFLDNTAAVHGGCEHLVLKEPHLTMYWPQLYELVPDAWFLMMIRDPRDVIASMISVGERTTCSPIATSCVCVNTSSRSTVPHLKFPMKDFETGWRSSTTRMWLRILRRHWLMSLASPESRSIQSIRKQPRTLERCNRM